MKFLCVVCDEAMKVAEIPGPSSGDALTVVFRCPGCGHQMALLTNPWEAQLVRSLGVAIGGRRAPPAPLELVGATLTEARLLWTEEAEQRLGRVPEFVRSAVRKSIERYARQQGYREVTPQVIDEAKADMGM